MWQAQHLHDLPLLSLLCRFLCCSSPPSHAIHSERNHIELSVGPTVPGAEHAQNYLKSCWGDLSFSPIHFFFFLFNSILLFLSVWIHAWLFCPLGCPVVIVRAFFAFAPVSWYHISVILSASLLIIIFSLPGCIRWFSLMFYISYPHPRCGHMSRNPPAFAENDHRGQYLSMRLYTPTSP